MDNINPSVTNRIISNITSRKTIYFTRTRRFVCCTQVCSLYQHQGADEDVALTKESPSQTEARHGHQNKIFPAQGEPENKIKPSYINKYIATDKLSHFQA